MIRRIFAAFALIVSDFGAADARPGCRAPESLEAIVYEDENLGGACHVLGLGAMSDVGDAGIEDDSISSVVVGDGARLVLYQHDDFGGKLAHFEGPGIYNTIGDANDRTSSLRVEATGDRHVASVFVANKPWHVANWLKEDVQGIAHNDHHLFVSDRQTIWALPRDFASLAAEAPPPSSPIFVMPSDLAKQGYFHFGDLDVYRSWIFVPVEGHDDLAPLVLVLGAARLHPIGSAVLAASPDGAAAWLAVNPATGLLYSSGAKINARQGLQVYSIDYEALARGRVAMVPVASVPISEFDGTSVDIQVTQGGVFSTDGGILYLSNGSEWGSFGDGGALRAVDTTSWRLVARSQDGYGPFDFHFDPGWGGDEPEGLDYFDADFGRQRLGELHALLLTNHRIFGSDAAISCEHFAVPAKQCEAGQLCPPDLGPDRACPGAGFAGFRCPGSNALTCPAGNFCPVRASRPRECAAATFCPYGSGAPQLCPAGSFCPSGSAHPIWCPQGTFCPTSSEYPLRCPPGGLCPTGSDAPLQGTALRHPTSGG